MNESSRGERAVSRAGPGLFVALVLWGMAFFFGPQCVTGCVRESGCSFPAHGSRRAGGLVEVTCFELPGQGPALEGAARLLFGLPLDLNRADSMALESLPSIGPARAGAIVGERCRAGFENLEALVRVHGIGRRTVEGLRGWAVAESAPVCPKADSRHE
jgi:competence protein ComEA